MRFYKSVFKLLLTLIISLSGYAAFAQNGTVRGFVYDSKTGEPVIFTNVYLEGTKYGIPTDVNGYYTLSKVPGGRYKLTVSGIGYEKFQEDIEIVENKIITKKITIIPNSRDINTVEISAEKQEAKTDVRMSVAKITPKEIKTLPSVGGEPDIAQYMQVLPGVIFSGDQGGQLYVRGGSPIQNKVMLDGMVIYNPFHSIGLYSVFDTDIIRNADVYTGGFGAKYGGRISAVMDITTRDGNKNNLSGKLSLSPFGAKALLEGPLKKQGESGGSSSFIISARNSYLKQTSKIFYDYVNTGGVGLPFNFSDLYGKVSFNSGTGSKFNAFGFNFTDNVRYQGISDLGWTNYGLGTNFVLVPAGNPVLIEGNLSYSNYKIGLEEPGLTKRTSEIGGFNLGFDFTYFKGDNEIKYGIQVLGFSTDFRYNNGSGGALQQQENTTELAGYFDYKIATGLLVIDPSIRYHYYASLSEGSLEPRLGLKYNISEFVRFKAAVGKYSQNLISANSDRDVVNLFYGFLSGPDNLPSTFTKPNGEQATRKSSLQKATHYIAGFEVDVTKNISVNVEGYYKVFNQLTNTNRNKIY
ncbi:MAG: TonB-dependent receptor, partial [Bacteroidota bacterium]